MGTDGRDASNGLLELDDPVGLDASTVKGVPTLVPSFDPRQYAQQSEIRERAPTLIDPEALEQARLKSLPTNVPPGPVPVAPANAELGVEQPPIDTAEHIALLRERLGPLGRVPILARKLTDLGSVLEDPKTAYVLGFVDGILPIETIVDVTGLPELDTLKVLARMVSLSVILFRPVGKPGA